MKNFFSMFPESAKNLKDVKTLTTMSMLMALQIILGIFTIPIGPTIKITFGYLAISCLGMLFGPVPAFLAGGIVDIISYFLTDKTGGQFHPGFTLVQMTGGLIYGICLYKAQTGKSLVPRIVICRVLIVIICNLLMNTYFISVLYGKGFLALFSTRVAKNLIQFPVDVVLMCAILPIAYTAYNKIRKPA